jgi:uncharacterized RDD family membrane protein YckC
MPEKLKVDTRMTVETPEGVDFQFVIAGPGKRCVAFALDSLIKVGTMILCVFLLMAITGTNGELPAVSNGIVLVIWFAMSWMYGACCEAFLDGRTLGKISQGLRVVRTNGTPIGWFEAFGRNLLLVPDSFLVFGPIALNTVGVLSMAATRRMQRLGDLVFDTMVIDEAREFISRSPDIAVGVDPIERAECRGRYHVPERTLAVIERLFEGDRLISDGRREEIARTLSVQLRERLGYIEPQPDPHNPNAFFAQAPRKHTAFLKRIIKTFADDGQGDTSEDAPLKKARTTSRRAVGSAADSSAMPLDRIVAEAADYEMEDHSKKQTATATLPTPADDYVDPTYLVDFDEDSPTKTSEGESS